MSHKTSVTPWLVKMDATLKILHKIYLNRPGFVHGAAALVFLAGFVIYTNFHKNAATGWQTASKVVPTSTLQTAIERFHPSGGFNPKNVRALKIQAKGAKDLYFIDLNSNNLCGTAGCLYVLYDPDGNLLLSLLLRPELPKGANLIASSGGVRNHFPCFSISQSGRQHATLNFQYCYEGAEFVVVNSFESGV